MLITVLAVTLLAYPIGFGLWFMGASFALSVIGFYAAIIAQLLFLAAFAVVRALCRRSTDVWTSPVP